MREEVKWENGRLNLLPPGGFRSWISCVYYIVSRPLIYLPSLSVCASLPQAAINPLLLVGIDRSLFEDLNRLLRDENTDILPGHLRSH